MWGYSHLVISVRVDGWVNGWMDSVVLFLSSLLLRGRRYRYVDWGEKKGFAWWLLGTRPISPTASPTLPPSLYNDIRAARRHGRHARKTEQSKSGQRQRVAGRLWLSAFLTSELGGDAVTDTSRTHSLIIQLATRLPADPGCGPLPSSSDSSKYYSMIRPSIINDSIISSSFIHLSSSLSSGRGFPVNFPLHSTFR